MTTGITQREFARLEGCDEKLVRTKIKQGYLAQSDDGTLDPALVGTGWRRRTYSKRTKAAEDAVDEEVVETARDAAAATISSSSYAMLPLDQAAARKMNFEALLKEHQYRLATGEVVAIGDVMDIVAAELHLVRSKLNQIPASWASRLAVIKSPEETKKMLEDAIGQALSELVYDVKQ